MVDKSTDHGNEVIVAQFHFLFSCSRFSAKVQWKWTSKTPNYCRKRNRKQFSWSVLLPTIRVKNFAIKPLALSFEHFDIISMVRKSTDHKKLLSIC